MSIMEVDNDQLKASSSSRKRKQPDDEEVTGGNLRGELLSEQQIENEYEHLDDEDEVDEDEDERALERKRAEYERILKAQEQTTISHYDDIKVTPFNLEEELEDGEFDKTGNFVFKKELTDDDNNDTWAESIDWSAVEQREREQELEKAKQSVSEESKDADREDHSEPLLDRLSCYKQMLRIMRPDETVQKTIRRLGNEVPKRSRSNQAKQESPLNAMGVAVDDAAGNIAEARKKLESIIELAHKRLEDGDIDIYQKSYEDLEDAINV